VLNPGGTFLAKVFQSGADAELQTQLKRDFASVRHVKPAASRQDSSERYVLATDFAASRSSRDRDLASMIEQPLDAPHIALAVVIMAIGSALQASVGIGLALFVVPLLALVDRSFIPAYAVGRCPARIDDGLSGEDGDRRGRAAQLAGRACGRNHCRVLTLKFVSGSDSHLDKTFGALVLLAVLIGVFGTKFEATPSLLMLAGGASGVMGAMVGIHGPPISLVLQNSEPRVIRGMLAPSSLSPMWRGRRARGVRIVRPA